MFSSEKMTGTREPVQTRKRSALAGGSATKPRVPQTQKATPAKTLSVELQGASAGLARVLNSIARELVAAEREIDSILEQRARRRA
jgi:hypothetical protein